MFWSSMCCTRQYRNREILGRCGEPPRLNYGSAAAPPACRQESLQTEEEIKGKCGSTLASEIVMHFKNTHDYFTTTSSH